MGHKFINNIVRPSHECKPFTHVTLSLLRRKQTKTTTNSRNSRKTQHFHFRKIASSSNWCFSRSTFFVFDIQIQTKFCVNICCMSGCLKILKRKLSSFFDIFIFDFKKNVSCVGLRKILRLKNVRKKVEKIEQPHA